MPPVSFPTAAAALAMLIALASPSTIVVMPRSAAAQTAGTSRDFALPESVSSGTVIRIDGSDSMRGINQTLQDGFEQAYSDTDVQTEYSGTAAALAALASGDIDLAAIGRPLTDEEKAQGLVSIPIERHKIALIVAPDNGFDGSLTTEQFSQIFRGEITDWSAVGGEPGAIRLVDRPEMSDTRQAFRGYPVFQQAPFEAGDTAVTLPEDSTQAVIQDLGGDGLGYAIADQVFDNPNVRIVPMHNTLPDDERYPFSQPLAYVYRGDNPSPAVQAFLGYATAPQNDEVLEAARVDAALSSIDGPAAGAATGDATGTTAIAGDAVPGEPAADGLADDVLPDGVAADDVLVGSAAGDATIEGANDVEIEEDEAGIWPWWWLLLLLGLPLLLFLLLRRRRTDVPPAAAPADDLDPAAPPVAVPDVDPAVGMVPGAASVPPAAVVPGADSVAPPQIAEVMPESPDAPLSGGVTPEAPAPIASDRSSAIPVVGGVAAAGAAAGLMAGRSADIPAIVPGREGEATRLSLSPQLSNTLDADWAFSAEDAADVAAQPGPLLLKLYDATDVDLADGTGPLVGQYHCDKNSQDLQIPAMEGDRDYAAELGYQSVEDQWIPLVRSEKVRLVSPTTDTVAGTVTGVVPDVGMAADTDLDIDSSAMGAGTAAAAAAAAAAMAASPAIGTSLGALPTEIESEDLAPADKTPLELESSAPTAFSQSAPSHVTLHISDGEAAIAQWAVSEKDQQRLQISSDSQLELRVHDVTAIDFDQQASLGTQTYVLSPDQDRQQVTVPIGDRDYLAELGYLDRQEGWTTLARSSHIYIPNGSPAVLPIGQLDRHSSVEADGLPPRDGLAGGAAVAVGLGAVAPTTTLSGLSDAQISQIILVPSSPLRAYVYWEISEAQRALLKEQGGRHLKLRVHDATGLDIDYQPPHHTMEFNCQESDRDCHVVIPTGDRDYIAEVGYTTDDGDWLRIIRSFHTWVPN
ncbi:MAG: DUF4912 domain-containing protein [Elainellaceae cyanobacterium]